MNSIGKREGLNSLKGNILDALIALQGICNCSQRDICTKLGYSKDVLSTVKSDDNYSGSKQLLSGLQLLLQLERLKQENAELRRKLSVVAEFRAMMGGVASLNERELRMEDGVSPVEKPVSYGHGRKRRSGRKGKAPPVVFGNEKGWQAVEAGLKSADSKTASGGVAPPGSGLASEK